MNPLNRIKCDLLIIGRGFAGMAAAARASELGLKTVQAGSSSGFFLASGLIDLLGVWPVEKKQIVTVPGLGLKQLGTDNTKHPYSRMQAETILEHLSFISSVLAKAGLPYTHETGRNQSVLTAAGTFKPSYMVPETFAAGCGLATAPKRVLFVDFKGLKGYSARQIADVLHRTCPDTSALTVDLPGNPHEVTPVQLANRFESTDFLEVLCEALGPHCGPFDLIGFPAVCGINTSPEIVRNLETRLGRPCFEIPGLPPSSPGLRLKNAFEKWLSQKDVTLLNNADVSFDSFRNDTFFMTAQYQNLMTSIEAKGVVLSTGRFQGRGLHASRQGITEPVFQLPVTQPGTRSQWHSIDFFSPSGHAVNRAGIEINSEFQAVNSTGQPAFEHLYAAGGILAHNDWIRLKSGAGVCFATAVGSVDRFYASQKGDQ